MPRPTSPVVVLAQAAAFIQMMSQPQTRPGQLSSTKLDELMAKTSTPEALRALDARGCNTLDLCACVAGERPWDLEMAQHVAAVAGHDPGYWMP